MDTIVLARRIIVGFPRASSSLRHHGADGEPFERLSGAEREAIGYDARSGALFVFYGRRKDALKILFFDGTGMVIFYKRFDSAVRRRRPFRSRRASS